MFRKVASGTSFLKYSRIGTATNVLLCRKRLFCDLIDKSTDIAPKTPAPVGPLKQISNRIQLYAALSKYRLSALVVVTSGAGYFAAGVPLDVEGDHILDQLPY